MYDYALLERGVVVGGVLVGIGLTGMLARRTLLPVVLSLVTICMGGIIMLAAAGGFHAEASGDWFGFCAFLTMVAIVAAGLTIVAQRHRWGLAQDVSLSCHAISADKSPGQGHCNDEVPTPVDAEPETGSGEAAGQPATAAAIGVRHRGEMESAPEDDARREPE